MSKKKTSVKTHTRKTKSGKTTVVKSHTREVDEDTGLFEDLFPEVFDISDEDDSEKTIDRLKEMKKKGRKEMTLSEVEKEYEKDGYDKTWMGADKEQKSQFSTTDKYGRQKHARLYEFDQDILVEEHKDLVSPEDSMIGHAVIDVGVVGHQRRQKNRNLNDSEVVTFTRKKKKGEK